MALPFPKNVSTALSMTIAATAVTLSMLTSCETTSRSSVGAGVSSEVKSFDTKATAWANHIKRLKELDADLRKLIAELNSTTGGAAVTQKIQQAAASLSEARREAQQLQFKAANERTRQISIARKAAEEQKQEAIRLKEEETRKRAEAKRKAAEEKTAKNAAAKEQRQLAKEKAALEKLRQEYASRQKKLEADRVQRHKELEKARQEAEQTRKEAEQKKMEETRKLQQAKAPAEKAQKSQNGRSNPMYGSPLGAITQLI